ncbi:hypothetical protein [Streptomyces mirabilis]|uniref:hypothetical protein n=1 Tax=Streptomyces mirabilis TaxID=68239 RepID=UPI0033212882
MLGAPAVSAATAAVPLLGAEPAAARSHDQGLSLTLLGANGGPPPLATRYGISSG